MIEDYFSTASSSAAEEKQFSKTDQIRHAAFVRLENNFGWIRINDQTLFSMQPGKIKLDSLIDKAGDKISDKQSPGRSIDLTRV